MAKSKERLAAEASLQMSWRQRLGNFWFYYKWIVLGSVLGAVMLVVFVSDMMDNVAPDYHVGLITPSFVTDETRQQLEDSITLYADDINGDGKVAVQVAVYQLPLEGETPTDPNTHMANVTRFSAELQSDNSMLLITNHVEDYQRQYGIFAYNDGTMPDEGSKDFSRIGVPLADCAALADFAATERLEDFGELYLCQRVMAPEQLERKEKLAASHTATAGLFDRLVQGKPSKQP